MFEWILLAAPVIYATPPQKDYVGVVAAEAAYASLLPNTPVIKPLVDTKDCKRCNGEGRIRTGDGHAWTDCPDCEPKDGTLKNTTKEAPLAPSMKLQVKPLPPVKTGDCPTGTCPLRS
jgi:hypothetical protein